jgi:hypothetical protein
LPYTVNSLFDINIVFLQAVSEPPAAIQAKQHAFARAALQQLHCAAIAEFSHAHDEQGYDHHQSGCLISLHFLPAETSLGYLRKFLGFLLRCAAFEWMFACHNL